LGYGIEERGFWGYMAILRDNVCWVHKMKRPDIIAVCIIALILVGCFTYQVATLDGFGGILGSIFFEDSTQYAAGYSVAAFRQVKVGMAEAEVYALLGQPLDTHSRDDTTYLWYSKPQKSHFRDRKIMLRNGLVVDKNTEFYVD
jgi:outer membrane protein assembly factor BamE (lipoprotein component of BamABCDE complex)